MAGNSTDVQEIDAASRTSVDDVREVIESIRYAAAPGKYRIFVIDEVHMLSTAAFNALLKTLEEPPPKSLFFFATTNPEKIPFTVLSRCQRFDLRRLTSSEIVNRLRTVATAENIDISDPSLTAIARESDGSMRDAMTLLDQVLAWSGEKIDDTKLTEILDLVDRRILFSILEACIQMDPAEALTRCARAHDAGIDSKRLAGELLRLLRDLVVLRIAPDAPELVDTNDAELASLRELAEKSEATRLRRMFRALMKEQEDLAWAPAPQLVLEMAIVRIATLPEGEDVAKLLARLDALEQRLSKGASPGNTNGSSSGSQGIAPKPSPSATSKAPLQSSTAAPPADASLNQIFDRFRVFAQERNRGLFAALEGGQLLELSEEHIRFRVSQDFLAQRLRERKEEIDQVLQAFFGRPLQFEIEGTSSEPPPSKRVQPQSQEQQRRQRHQALRHPALNTALELLGGEVVEIRPLGESQ